MARFFELKVRLRPEWVVQKLSDAMPPEGSPWWCDFVDWQGTSDGLELDFPVIDPRREEVPLKDPWVHAACVAAVTGYAELRVTAPGEHHGRFIRLTYHRIQHTISRLDTGPLRDMSDHWAFRPYSDAAGEFFQLYCFGSVPFAQEP